jgi:hypothetical protein
VKQGSNNLITISEQSSPPQFSEVPDSYAKLLQSLNQYAVYESANGTFYLTKPTELKGGQAAVMNAKGVLLFAKPTQDLSDKQWKQLFNDLSLVR